MRRDELIEKAVEAMTEAADCWDCCGSEGLSTYSEMQAQYVLDAVVPLIEADLRARVQELEALADLRAGVRVLIAVNAAILGEDAAHTGIGNNALRALLGDA